MNTNWKKRLTNVLALLFTGAVLIPVCAYLAGIGIVGSYEGDGGVAGYLATIYAAAWTGDFAARFLILAPLLIAVTWLVASRLSRPDSPEPGAQPD